MAWCFVSLFLAVYSQNTEQNGADLIFFGDPRGSDVQSKASLEDAVKTSEAFAAALTEQKKSRKNAPSLLNSKSSKKLPCVSCDDDSTALEPSQVPIGEAHAAVAPWANKRGSMSVSAMTKNLDIDGLYKALGGDSNASSAQEREKRVTPTTAEVREAESVSKKLAAAWLTQHKRAPYLHYGHRQIAMSEDHGGDAESQAVAFLSHMRAAKAACEGCAENSEGSKCSLTKECKAPLFCDATTGMCTPSSCSNTNLVKRATNLNSLIRGGSLCMGPGKARVETAFEELDTLRQRRWVPDKISREYRHMMNLREMLRSSPCKLDDRGMHTGFRRTANTFLESAKKLERGDTGSFCDSSAGCKPPGLCSADTKQCAPSIQGKLLEKSHLLLQHLEYIALVAWVKPTHKSHEGSVGDGMKSYESTLEVLKRIYLNDNAILFQTIGKPDVRIKREEFDHLFKELDKLYARSTSLLKRGGSHYDAFDTHKALRLTRGALLSLINGVLAVGKGKLSDTCVGFHKCDLNLGHHECKAPFACNEKKCSADGLLPLVNVAQALVRDAHLTKVTCNTVGAASTQKSFGSFQVGLKTLGRMQEGRVLYSSAYETTAAAMERALAQLEAQNYVCDQKHVELSVDMLIASSNALFRFLRSFMRPNGAECIVENECEPDHTCVSGKCVIGSNIGQECRNRAECASMFLCGTVPQKIDACPLKACLICGPPRVSNEDPEQTPKMVQRGTQCLSDNECGGGKFCNELQWQCQARRRYKEDCRRRGWCISDLCGPDDKCKKKGGASCTQDAECSCGKCLPTKVCGPCDADKEEENSRPTEKGAANSVSGGGSGSGGYDSGKTGESRRGHGEGSSRGDGGGSGETGDGSGGGAPGLLPVGGVGGSTASLPDSSTASLSGVGTDTPPKIPDKPGFHFPIPLIIPPPLFGRNSTGSGGSGSSGGSGPAEPTPASSGPAEPTPASSGPAEPTPTNPEETTPDNSSPDGEALDKCGGCPAPMKCVKNEKPQRKDPPPPPPSPPPPPGKKPEYLDVVKNLVDPPPGTDEKEAAKAFEKFVSGERQTLANISTGFENTDKEADKDQPAFPPRTPEFSPGDPGDNKKGCKKGLIGAIICFLKKMAKLLLPAAKDALKKKLADEEAKVTADIKAKTGVDVGAMKGLGFKRVASTVRDNDYVCKEVNCGNKCVSPQKCVNDECVGPGALPPPGNPVAAMESFNRGDSEACAPSTPQPKAESLIPNAGERKKKCGAGKGIGGKISCFLKKVSAVTGDIPLPAAAAAAAAKLPPLAGFPAGLIEVSTKLKTHASCMLPEDLETLLCTGGLCGKEEEECQPGDDPKSCKCKANKAEKILCVVEQFKMDVNAGPSKRKIREVIVNSSDEWSGEKMVIESDDLLDTNGTNGTNTSLPRPNSTEAKQNMERSGVVPAELMAASVISDQVLAAMANTTSHQTPPQVTGDVVGLAGSNPKCKTIDKLLDAAMCFESGNSKEVCAACSLNCGCKQLSDSPAAEADDLFREVTMVSRGTDSNADAEPKASARFKSSLTQFTPKHLLRGGGRRSLLEKPILHIERAWFGDAKQKWSPAGVFVTQKIQAKVDAHEEVHLFPLHSDRYYREWLGFDQEKLSLNVLAVRYRYSGEVMECFSDVDDDEHFRLDITVSGCSSSLYSPTKEGGEAIDNVEVLAGNRKHHPRKAARKDALKDGISSKDPGTSVTQVVRDKRTNKTWVLAKANNITSWQYTLHDHHAGFNHTKYVPFRPLEEKVRYDRLHKKWVVLAPKVCFGARKNSFGSFDVPRYVDNIIALKLVSLPGSGGISCDGGVSHANYGCPSKHGDRMISVVLTTASESVSSIIAPADSAKVSDTATLSHHGAWYEYPGSCARCNALNMDTNRLFTFPPKTTYKLWFGEDYNGAVLNEAMYSGETCVKVLAHPCEDCAPADTVQKRNFLE